MHRYFAATLAGMLASTFVGYAFAQKMPEGATKMTPAEIKTVYANHTARFPDINAYYAPDGKYYSYDSKGKKWWFVGSWSVKGNVSCINGKWTEVATGKTGGLDKRSCNTWIKSKDGQILQSWSQDPGWSDPSKDLSSGDRGVIKTVSSLQAKTKK